MTGLLYGSLGGAWCGITMVWWLLDERVRWRARHTQANTYTDSFPRKRRVM